MRKKDVINKLKDLTPEGNIIAKWQFGMLSRFRNSLMETIAYADKDHRDNLKKHFVQEVLAYEKYAYKEGWWEKVKDKIRGYYD